MDNFLSMFGDRMRTNCWMHEQVIYSEASEEAPVAYLVKDYCMMLLKIADECGSGSGAGDPLTVDLFMQVEGEAPVRSSEDMGEFLETLWSLTQEPKPFVFECKYQGRVAEKNWITDKNGQKYILDVRRQYIVGGVKEHIEEFLQEEKFTYKQCVRYNDSGEWEFVKMEDGVETDYTCDAFYEKDAFGWKRWRNARQECFPPLTTSGVGNWESAVNMMFVLVDEKKHPDVMEKLYAIMEKYLPADAAAMAKEEREYEEPHERQILCMDSYWDPKDITALQPLLDELNAVLLPVKEDIVDVATSGFWVDMDNFRIATWMWTEAGFRLGVLSY